MRNIGILNLLKKEKKKEDERRKIVKWYIEFNNDLISSKIKDFFFREFPNLNEKSEMYINLGKKLYISGLLSFFFLPTHTFFSHAKELSRSFNRFYDCLIDIENFYKEKGAIEKRDDKYYEFLQKLGKSVFFLNIYNNKIIKILEKNKIRNYDELESYLCEWFFYLSLYYSFIYDDDEKKEFF